MSHDERPTEQEAVRTTIVGGRPPGSGKTLGPIPRGIEVLVKKAAVDPGFKETLMTKRAKAADEIDLKLEPAETAMLSAVPSAQLETIIANTEVADLTRAAFLGRAAAVMLAALGVSTVSGCSDKPSSVPGPDREPTKGIKPDKPEPKPEPTRPDVPATEGIRPDRPEPKPDSKPALEERTKGIRPDRPAPKPATEPNRLKQEAQPEDPPERVEAKGVTGISPEGQPKTKEEAARYYATRTLGIRPNQLTEMARPPTYGLDSDKVSAPTLSATEIKKRVDAMVALLGNPEQNVRSEAKLALLGMGPTALPALKQAKAPTAAAGEDLRAIIEALEAKTAK